MVATELGKYPNEVENAFTPYDLAEFIAYKNIVAEEYRKAVKRQESLDKKR